MSSPLPSTDVVMSNEESVDSKYQKLKMVFTKYLKEHTVYETIPENMKILVFNSELTISDSIEAMIKEDIYCGLLWDTSQSKYVGLFTIRDVLSLIKIAYAHCVSFLSKHDPSQLNSITEEIFNVNNNNMEIDDDNVDLTAAKSIFDTSIKNFGMFFKLFDNVTIKQYIEVFKEKDKKMVSLSLDGNLQDCIKLIRENHIHRIVVEDLKSATITGFITYEAIFEFFIENYYSEMTEFAIPLSSIENIISKSIITLEKKESIMKAMETFYEKKISLIPIVDGDNQNEIFGYFYLKDIIYFFSNGEKFSFNDSIESFLVDLYDDIDSERPFGKDRIVEIEEGDNLKNVFEQMSICPERKLIVKDKNYIGVITLSNIFSNLVD